MTWHLRLNHSPNMNIYNHSREKNICLKREFKQRTDVLLLCGFGVSKSNNRTCI